MTIDNILEEAESFTYKEFGLKLIESNLKILSGEDYHTFCKRNDFTETDGLYVPKTKTAYVKSDSPHLVTNIFHEYFGHGLFCEHSEIGKSLVSFIKSENFNEEKSYLEKNLGNYEGFAMWMESQLSVYIENTESWEDKYKTLPRNYQELYQTFKEAESKLTKFGLMSQLGFPKYYDGEKILNLIKHFYNSSFDNIEFVILYGSQKPESDIDLFIVSKNKSMNYFNGWLDVYEVNVLEFQDKINKLDLSMTDPLFSGSLIYGDSLEFEKIKIGIKTQEITPETIEHHKSVIQEQESYLGLFKNSPRELKNSLSYIDSYTKNGELLRKGYKALTLRGLDNGKM